MGMTFEELYDGIRALNRKLDILTEIVKNIQRSECADDEPMDVEAAARFLKIAVRTVYDKVYKKQLPFYKKGKHLYFYKEELDAYIASGKPKGYEEYQNEAMEHMKKRKRIPASRYL
ncbi:helix-turn-helix domain-containing protein [Olivibacter jilunii]|uniref:helix-turn-helix domain-containing protein n=1 Tax=Olivibacter jilunii TaxID=985016 RepID=UPI0010312320|nr:helix-turn-helix domain-containing protein [Olivibacter jilunii]